MENATKALLMVAGVFFALLIITVSILVYRQISDYYKSQDITKQTEQLATFNKQYSAYNREDVRGSELLSLINKIIDFNARKEYSEKEIKISIIIPNSEKAKLFYYQYNKYNYGSDKKVTLIKTNNKYTHQNIETSFLNEANRIANDYKGKADNLSANISTLLGENSLKTRQQLLNQLNINFNVNNNDILKYYQYQQFKRAHFDCKSLKFTQDGRVESFEFKFNEKFE